MGCTDMGRNLLELSFVNTLRMWAARPESSTCYSRWGIFLVFGKNLFPVDREAEFRKFGGRMRVKTTLNTIDKQSSF